MTRAQATWAEFPSTTGNSPAFWGKSHVKLPAFRVPADRQSLERKYARVITSYAVGYYRDERGQWNHDSRPVCYRIR